MEEVFLSFTVVSSIFFAQYLIKDFEENCSIVCVRITESSIGDFIVYLPNANTCLGCVLVRVLQKQQEKSDGEDHCAVCQVVRPHQIGAAEETHELGLAGWQLNRLIVEVINHIGVGWGVDGGISDDLGTRECTNVLLPVLQAFGLLCYVFNARVAAIGFAAIFGVTVEVL